MNRDALLAVARARRWWLIAGAVVLLGAAGYGVYRQVQVSRERQAALAALRTEAIVRGDIIAAVGATGTLAPERQANLFFIVPGTVVEVLVESGDSVRAGQVLARLDATPLRLAARQAEDALAVAELSRQKLLAGPTQADVAAAKADLRSANAALADLVKGAAEQDVAVAQLKYDDLLKKHQQAAEQYSGLLTLGEKYPMFAPPQEAVDSARNAMDNTFYAAETARLLLQQVQNGADHGSRTVASARVAQAQAVLNQLRAKPGALQLQQAALAVEQARMALEQARLRLARAEMTAPFAGVVAGVYVKAGEPAAAGGPAVTLLDLSRFHIDVTVDEVDVALLAPGQAVSVTLDALPQVTLTGSVDRLAPVATTTGGIVNYAVRLVLDRSDAPLRSGMSATADIAVAEARAVLLVPNWAIRRDRRTGQAYASLKVGNQLVEVEIETGLRGENYTEARRGVNAGDIAAVTTARNQFNFFGAGQ